MGDEFYHPTDAEMGRIYEDADAGSTSELNGGLAEIKPCPFKCYNPKGHKPEIEPQIMNDGDEPDPLYIIRCGACDAAGPVESTPEKAIASWNNYDS